MKLSPQKREETSSAAITQTLLAMLGCFGLLGLATLAADPSWWTNSGTGSQPAVMSPQVVTNDGVVSTNYVTNAYAVVVQGQLKQFTARAVDEMNAYLPGGAGTNLNTMVSNWAQDYLTNGYNATNIKPSDYTAMTVGQLKYIGSNVWTQLVGAGYTNALPSWLANTNAGDYSAANIGQLKTVFNFDFSLAGPTNLSESGNTNGTIVLNWTLPTNNQATSYLIEQQTIADTWEVIATLTNVSATSYTVTGLANGEHPVFQIIAQNGVYSSQPHTTPADSGLIAPSSVNGIAGQAPGEIDLTWQNNATDATYVTIHESPDGVNWTPIAYLPPTATFYAVTNLTVGQAYYFGVSAGNN